MKKTSKKKAVRVAQKFLKSSTYGKGQPEKVSIRISKIEKSQFSGVYYWYTVNGSPLFDMVAASKFSNFVLEQVQAVKEVEISYALGVTP